MTGPEPSPPHAPGGVVAQVVLQPTPFCNLDCSYCYLPDRGDRARMTVDVAAAALRRVWEYGRHRPTVDVRWHAGEPLTVPRSFYRDAFRRLGAEAPGDVELAHSLQTNGVLVTPAWAALLAEHRVRVGVSIDGPAHLHDSRRRTRAGHPTHDLVLRGLRRLRSVGVDLEAIAVVTSDTVTDPDGFYRFFADLGLSRLGLNIEETEGINTSSLADQAGFADRYRAFLDRLAVLQEDGPTKVRELTEIEQVIRGGPGARPNDLVSPLAIVSVDHRGAMSTFSPELLSAAGAGRFAYGHVSRDRLDAVLGDRRLVADWVEVERGRAACEAGCGYYEVCGGGAPSNKLHETGTFAATATNYCRWRFMTPSDVVLDHLERSASTRPAIR